MYIHAGGSTARSQSSKSFRVRRDARRRRDAPQIGVGEQVGRERLKPGPHRRRGGRPRTRADDGKRLVHRRCRAYFFGRSYRPRYFSAGYFSAFFTIFARMALDTSSPSSLASANE